MKREKHAEDEIKSPLWKAMVVGNPDCPVFVRYKLIDIKGWKLLFHRFFEHEDQHLHDHPWPFITLVIKGGYVDLGPDRPDDHLHVGSVRRRPARHVHRTIVGPRGCWTLLATAPTRREWGFWRDGKWWPWMRYAETFGPTMRCDEGT